MTCRLDCRCHSGAGPCLGCQFYRCDRPETPVASAPKGGKDHAGECGTRCVWGDKRCPVANQDERHCCACGVAWPFGSAHTCNAVGPCPRSSCSTGDGGHTTANGVRYSAFEVECMKKHGKPSAPEGGA